ncbi:hypothetical protein XELAEV_18022611mg [Xenopus laevis]|uniref:Uncharacterized protein n=1 Tax=Xenopus laevis TaxID=8355 RepID=A0A974D2J5_XENLA|nr:hypothetical protein XELAEV_18022611mg [Xenopus laevis]
MALCISHLHLIRAAFAAEAHSKKRKLGEMPILDDQRAAPTLTTDALEFDLANSLRMSEDHALKFLSRSWIILS